MAQKEGFVDKGLDTWQRWNKLTLTAEGIAILGGLLFGVPWLIALGATGAAIDGAQIYGINRLKEWRKKRASPNVEMEQGMWHLLSKPA